MAHWPTVGVSGVLARSCQAAFARRISGAGAGARLNAAIKKLIALVATGNLVRGGHPVMAHHASCLCTASDGSDLSKPVKPDREKDFSRIDLLAATIDALARALVFEDKGIRPAAAVCASSF